MTRLDVGEMLRNGESSGVEFKIDRLEPQDLARQIVCFSNLAGGVILLGVGDDGQVVGTTRDNLEEWVIDVCRSRVDPPVIPFVEWYKDFEPGKHVAIVRVLPGLDKPYACIHNNRRNYFIRVGRACREAGREELERMFQASGKLRYGMKPVPGTSLADLDLRRLQEYFGRVLSQEYPALDDIAAWQRLLTNLELAVSVEEMTVPSVDGILLFGRNPKKALPQSGIRAICHTGDLPDYAARVDRDLNGPLLPLTGTDGSFIELGLVEQALDFVTRNTEPSAYIDMGRRIDRPAYPPEVLREVIVNALVHRDYSIAGTDISLLIFSDRLEVKSPGRLPNTATIEALKAGFRYARNQTLVNVMRDYRYVEFRGMGIKDKVIPGMMRHNGTEPEFFETEHDFTVRLWKEKPH